MGALLNEDLSDANIMDIESEETKSIDLKLTNPIEKRKEALGESDTDGEILNE